MFFTVLFAVARFTDCTDPELRNERGSPSISNEPSRYANGHEKSGVFLTLREESLEELFLIGEQVGSVRRDLLRFQPLHE